MTQISFDSHKFGVHAIDLLKTNPTFAAVASRAAQEYLKGKFITAKTKIDLIKAFEVGLSQVIEGYRGWQ